jgi:hypothetical protein
MIKILICCQIWYREKLKIFLYTCAVIFKAIVAMIYWKISWVAIRLLSHKHQNKWIFKSSMIYSHLQHEKCSTIRYDKPKQIYNNIIEWAKNKQTIIIRCGWTTTAFNEPFKFWTLVTYLVKPLTSTPQLTQISG